MEREKNKSAKAGEKKLLPAIKSDAAAYFLREEAKVSTKGIAAGAAALIALGMISDPTWGWHSSVHANINLHTNQGGVNGHTNTGAANMHFNSSSHVNLA
ncbi:MAG TPA: hypothetical protein PK745_09075, partial [bacterium]|nr:hypothetical protein [bacterium]